MPGWAWALAGLWLLAPAQPQTAVRGVLLTWDVPPVGDLCVRVRDNHVYCSRFDATTTVERGGLPAGLWDLRNQDTVEVLTGPGPNPYLPHADRIRVLNETAPVKPSYELRNERLFPGDLT